MKRTHDLRYWLNQVEKTGNLKKVQGAGWDMDIGCISDLNVKGKDRPVLLFDGIGEYAPGYRVATCSVANSTSVGFALNLPLSLSDNDLVVTLQEKLPEWESRLDSFQPRVVDSGPVLENVHSGNEVNLLEFPVPRWHDLDGGRYIGTGDAVITRDPDTGAINLGTYRIMVHDETTAALYISPGKHGRIHYEKYHERGKACPVVVSIGHHPLIFCIARHAVAEGTEYQLIGSIQEEPVRVIIEELTGLPVPADSEIVIAGWCPPDKTRIEGPFGEWTGYYAAGARPAPVIEVERIYHRRDPIMLGCPPNRPPGDDSYYSVLVGSARIYNDLIKGGVPDVRGVWMGMATHHTFIIVSIKQRYAGHARQAGILASQSSIGAYMGRYVVVVDEDIDPSNMDDVLWAMCFRSDPEKDIDVVRKAWSTPLDPVIRKPANGFFNSRAIIDACKPFEWIDEFPPVVQYDPEFKKRIKERWGSALGL